MNATSPRLPDVLLERYLLGELPPDRRRDIENLLRADAELASRLQALRDSNRDILAAYPALPALPARETPRPRRLPLGGRNPGGRGFRGWNLRSPWFPAAGAAFASLVLLAYLFPAGLLGRAARDADGAFDPANATVSPDPEIRYKGHEAGLAIYRKSRSGSELLPPHSLARSGDTLQVFYRSLADLHGIIFSVDGNGALTLHLPEAGDQSAPLARGDMRPLPHAYLLDRAPRLERFYLVTSPAPFPVAAVLAEVRQGLRAGAFPSDSLAGLPEGFRQYSYTLKKADARPKGGTRSGKDGRP